MKGTEKSQIYDELLELIYGHFSAHRMAQWNNKSVIEKLSEMLLKRIYKRFDVSYKRPHESQEINTYGDDDWATPQD